MNIVKQFPNKMWRYIGKPYIGVTCLLGCSVPIMSTGFLYRDYIYYKKHNNLDYRSKLTKILKKNNWEIENINIMKECMYEFGNSTKDTLHYLLAYSLLLLETLYNASFNRVKYDVITKKYRI